MHIAMITAFPKDPHTIEGGVAGVAKYLVDGFAKYPDVRITIVVPRGKVGQGQVGQTVYDKWDNCDIHRSGISRIGALLPTTVYDIIAGRRRLNKLLCSVRPDIVHYQGTAYLAAGCPFPKILTIHGIVERDALWVGKAPIRWLRWLIIKLSENYGRRRVPYIVLISDYAGQIIPKNNSLKKTWRIDNPVADAFFDIQWAFEPGRIFCCSTVRPLKNILGMIKAFAEVAEQFAQSQLRIAGAAEPDYLTACMHEVQMRNLQNKVHFLGNLTVEDIQLELSRANCLAIPSFQENAPLAVEEAMAVGVPVVGARVGGIPEMVEDGRTGFLIDPYSTSSIAEAVLKILSKETLAKTMSQRARNIARERFLASAVVQKIMQTYHVVLSDKA
jgi:glycosyltransferase involved in cell wall biosynthesis